MILAAAGWLSEIFALTLKRLKLPGERCVFVDDVASYLPAARALRMATIHATDPATTVAELKRIFSSHPLTRPPAGEK